MKARKNRPTRVELGEKQLTIQWAEGEPRQFSLADLRRSCPCAMCREARGDADVSEGGELSQLTGESATATSAASGMDFVGHYGIRIQWADGHNTGIYTFAALRELAAS